MIKIGQRVPYQIRFIGRNSDQFDGFKFGRVVSFDGETVCIVDNGPHHKLHFLSFEHLRELMDNYKLYKEKNNEK